MRYDFHGLKLEEVDKIFDTLINDACNMRDSTIYLVTGNGKIKERIKELGKEYGYNINEKLGNSGVLVLDLNMEI